MSERHLADGMRTSRTPCATPVSDTPTGADA